MPPFWGNELWDNDGDGGVGTFQVNGIKIAHNRFDEGAVGRVEDHKRHIMYPLLPALDEPWCLFGVYADMDGAAVTGYRASVFQSLHNATMQGGDEHEDDVFLRFFRRAVVIES